MAARMFIRCCAALASRPPRASASYGIARSRRLLHAASALRAATVRVSDAGDAGGGDAGGSDADDAPTGPSARGGRARDSRERRGRAFLDPRAPRRQEHIRSSPDHGGWGGMIDVLEHAAYCDGQREEDPDGFFFDGVVPEYDSDCEGDPFSNGYLTEDELEFDEGYKPAPYVPGRVADQIHFLSSVRRWPMQRLCAAYHLSSERVSAILNLKASEPEAIAAGMFTSRIDDILEQMYGDRFKKHGNASSKGSRLAKALGALPHAGVAAPPVGGQDNWQPDYDLGVNYEMLRDDQEPEDMMPVRRKHGTTLRMGHRLRDRPGPPRETRTHASRFVFVSIAGRKNDKRGGRPMTVSEWDGRIHPATNRDAIYRSWETRHWDVKAGKGTDHMPFKDEDADKPAKYRVAP